MGYRSSLFIFIIILLCCLVSCTHISKQMPSRLGEMHDFLTKDSPSTCRNYHYNYERQAPRLYHDHKQDSILNVIEYIKTECGPASNLEVTRLLLLAEKGLFGDSLIGSSTIPQMLWYRSQQEYLFDWKQWDYLYGSSQPTDNTHDNFTKFRTNLAQQITSDSEAMPTAQTFGMFYGGAFDSALSHIQSDEMHGTAIQRYYYDFVRRTKRMFPSRGNVAILIGSWNPQGNNNLLGNHPEIGLQLGGEGRLWRMDAIISYRFSSAKNEFLVDSLGSIASTNKFNSWLFGVEGGYKFFDNSIFSTDLFFGLGYDVIYSLTKENHPNEFVSHGSLALSFGLRQRFFLNKQNGWYIGGIVRYSIVDYANPGGTDLSGNTLTISIVSGWSIHETLNQFLRKLNYKGNWRK